MFEPIPFEDFESRSEIRTSDLVHGWGSAEKVISLRQMVEVIDVRIMPRDYLHQLLTRIPLTGDNSRIYEGCDILTARIDPSVLVVGQTFVERGKYQAFLETFQDVFDGFCVTRGVAKCTALIVFGYDELGVPSIAHYLPPIIEVHDRWFLLDGVHRNFLVRTIGTTLESIIITKPQQSFPCGGQGWDRVSVVEDKPPKGERFVDLRPQLFRDLKYIGIDG